MAMSTSALSVVVSPVLGDPGESAHVRRPSVAEFSDDSSDDSSHVDVSKIITSLEKSEEAVISKPGAGTQCNDENAFCVGDFCTNCEQDEMDVVPCTEDEDSSSLDDLPLLSGKRKLQGLSTTPSKRRCRNSSKENLVYQDLVCNQSRHALEDEVPIPSQSGSESDEQGPVYNQSKHTLEEHGLIFNKSRNGQESISAKETATKPKHSVDEDHSADTSVDTIFPATQALDDLSSSQLSQMDRRLDKMVNSTSGSLKVNRMLQRLRAKSRLADDKTKTTAGKGYTAGSHAHPSGQPTPSLDDSTAGTSSEGNEDDVMKIETFITRCKAVVMELKKMFRDKTQLHDLPRVKAWQEELEKIDREVCLPKTTIAVVGETGAGKSSMLNALFDQSSLLPTSGMRACTAVVVEVSENCDNSNYEADIKFLSEQEWYDELEHLIKELTDKDGKLHSIGGDPRTTVSGAAIFKVKAVYGKVKPLDELKQQRTVTQCLGTVKKISVTNARNLRLEIDRYIESSEMEDETEKKTKKKKNGGQYWPIVKSVHIRVPNCDICKSGVVLVDLPGVGDSNLARDKIAREYVKNCCTVWVVANIQRAVDNRTAKDLLGENFRRQLLMDGQYGKVAFICTKTDNVVPSETMRSIKNLKDKCQGLQKEMTSLEDELHRLRDTCRDCASRRQTLKNELSDLQLNVTEATDLIDSLDSDSEKDALEELQNVLAEDIKRKENEINKLQKEKEKTKQQILGLERKLSDKRKAISAKCAEARNEYSTNKIRNDFRDGLREMKRKANVPEQTKNEDVDKAVSSAENLDVFCVSAMEYMKLKELLSSNDGTAQVFSTPHDTGIPRLQQFVKSMASARRMAVVKQVIQNVGHFLFDLENYMAISDTGAGFGSEKISSVVEKRVQEVKDRTTAIIQKLSMNISETFNSVILPKLNEGVSNGKDQAGQISEKWGSKPNKEDRKLGGLLYPTYKATIHRHGVFNSPTAGSINFNEDLSAPVLSSITMCWDQVFNDLFWKPFDRLEKDLLKNIERFCTSVKSDLLSLDVPSSRLDSISEQVRRKIKTKLTEMVSLMKQFVTNQQRDISRLVPEKLQEHMLPTYHKCKLETGQGCFKRMRMDMAEGVKETECTMYNDVSDDLMQQVYSLQESVVKRVEDILFAMCDYLKASFEPLWQDSPELNDMRETFLKCISSGIQQIEPLYRNAGITFPVRDRTLSIPNVARPSGSPCKQPASLDVQIGLLHYDVVDLKMRQVLEEKLNTKQEECRVRHRNRICDSTVVKQEKKAAPTRIAQTTGLPGPTCISSSPVSTGCIMRRNQYTMESPSFQIPRVPGPSEASDSQSPTTTSISPRISVPGASKRDTVPSRSVATDTPIYNQSTTRTNISPRTSVPGVTAPIDLSVHKQDSIRTPIGIETPRGPATSSGGQLVSLLNIQAYASSNIHGSHPPALPLIVCQPQGTKSTTPVLQYQPQGSKSTTPVLQYQPTTPVLQYEPTMPVLPYQPTTPDLQYQPTTPVLQYQPQGSKSTTPVLQYQPTMPVLQYEPTMPVLQYQPTTPVLQYQPTTPILQYQPTTPVLHFQPQGTKSTPVLQNQTQAIQVTQCSSQGTKSTISVHQHQLQRTELRMTVPQDQRQTTEPGKLLSQCPRQRIQAASVVNIKSEQIETYVSWRPM